MAFEKKKGGRPTNKPNDDVLSDLLSKHTSVQIAAMYGVSSSTVRAWAYHARKRAGVVKDGV